MRARVPSTGNDAPTSPLPPKPRREETLARSGCSQSRRCRLYDSRPFIYLAERLCMRGKGWDSLSSRLLVCSSTRLFVSLDFGDSSGVGASLGRVFVMASLRFGHQKNTSQLMAPDSSRDFLASWLMAPASSRDFLGSQLMPPALSRGIPRGGGVVVFV